MKIYKKKQIKIFAKRYDGTEESFKEIRAWVKTGEVTSYNDKKLRVPTLEGFHDASIGDFIIRGIKGEFYPCKPDIFKATYEEEHDKKILDTVEVIENEN